jgi:hypothetical protein
MTRTFVPNATGVIDGGRSMLSSQYPMTVGSAPSRISGRTHLRASGRTVVDGARSDHGARILSGEIPLVGPSSDAATPAIPPAPAHDAGAAADWRGPRGRTGAPEALTTPDVAASSPRGEAPRTHSAGTASDGSASGVRPRVIPHGSAAGEGPQRVACPRCNARGPRQLGRLPQEAHSIFMCAFCKHTWCEEGRVGRGVSGKQ